MYCFSWQRCWIFVSLAMYPLYVLLSIHCWNMLVNKKKIGKHTCTNFRQVCPQIVDKFVRGEKSTSRTSSGVCQHYGRMKMLYVLFRAWNGGQFVVSLPNRTSGPSDSGMTWHLCSKVAGGHCFCSFLSEYELLMAYCRPLADGTARVFLLKKRFRIWI